jgi:GT2 family glycosyltransferase
MTAKHKSGVAVCVLTFNSRRWIEECLSTLLRSDYTPLDVVVIDNASSDGTAETVRSRFPRVTLLQNPENLGCAEGNNIGLRWALAHASDYALILNPDTRIEPDCIRKLVAAAERDDQWGMLSPLQMNYTGSATDPKFALVLERNGHPVCWTPGEGHDQVLAVDGVIGASMLIRLAMVRRIGGFDPIYFAYGEEDDLCRRARYHGWRIAVVPDARVMHWHRSVHEERHKRLNYFSQRAKYIYKLKDPKKGSFITFLRYVRATADDLSELLSLRSRSTLRQFMTIHVFVMKNLRTIREHVRLERRGFCHLG